MKTIVSWVMLVALFSIAAFGQSRKYPDRTKRRMYDTRVVPPASDDRNMKTVDQREYSEIFEAVERGILGGNVGMFSGYFGPQIFVNLPGGQSGYYSANQAYYILQNYLGARRPQSFRFSTFGESDGASYATGGGRFEMNGSVQTIQVYAAVSRAGGQWKLTQVNIY